MHKQEYRLRYKQIIQDQPDLSIIKIKYNT